METLFTSQCVRHVRYRAECDTLLGGLEENEAESKHASENDARQRGHGEAGPALLTCGAARGRGSTRSRGRGTGGLWDGQRRGHDGCGRRGSE